MRIRNASQREVPRPRLQMASMIDVVFLLLIFFVMTFHVTALEGEFRIASAGARKRSTAPPDVRKTVLRVRLTADQTGSLVEVRLDGRNLRDLQALRSAVNTIVDRGSALGGGRNEFAIQLHADQRLRYQCTIDAMTAIRGAPRTPLLIKDIQLRVEP